MIEAIWDMETADPDDFLTLLFLLGHPQVSLRAVTIMPGTPQQVGLVRRAVNEWFGRAIPIGAYQIERESRAVSPWHTGAYGPATPSTEARPGAEVLLECCGEAVTLICGAPLKNLGAALRLEAEAGRRPLRLREAVIQGGFAGEGIVPRERQLPKFAGWVTCPSYNVNGDPKAVLAVQRHPGIGVRRFVSKNVCHRVIYDRAVHERVGQVKDRNLGLAYIWQGMEHYLARRGGKAIHDLLAAACAIDPAIGVWAEVEVYRERDEWGARLSPGSGTWIIVDYDRERFLATLLAY